MKKPIFFKQRKPLTVVILGIVLFIFALLVFREDATRLEPIITMLGISSIVLGYSVSFEIKEDYNHKKHFKFFGITVFRSKLNCFIPEYVTVFSSFGTNNSEWGPIAAMGKNTKDEYYIVRVFKDNKHFTLMRTNSYNIATSKAKDLGALLKIKVYLKN